MTRQSWPDDDRGGGPSVEAAILTVVVGVLIALGLAAGRLAAAESATDHAARAAARTASIQRDVADARAMAVAEATRALKQRGLACDRTSVALDVEPPAAPIGAAAFTRAVVTCVVRWSDLGLPGVPGTREVRAEFTSPIDRYRERP
jgi:hypothetical protein